MRKPDLSLYRNDSPGHCDRKILDFFSRRGLEGGFYVEAGAVNGVYQSNTFLLEKVLGWSGILIEPDPRLCQQCLMNRPGNIIQNCALVDDNHEGAYATFYHAKDLNNYADFLCGKVVENNEYFKQGEDEGYSPIKVPAKKLSSILNSYLIDKVDFLSLDVEGYEINALNGLDLKTNRPRYILLETTTDEEKRKNMGKYLSEYNYKFVEQITFNDALYADRLNENL